MLNLQPASARQVHETLAADGSGRAYTTTVTTLDRLVDRGDLAVRMDGSRKTYSVQTSNDPHEAACEFNRIVERYGDLAPAAFVNTLKKHPALVGLLREEMEQSS